MFKQIFLTGLLMASGAFACTKIPMAWHFDTLETGVVRITRTSPVLVSPHDSVVTYADPTQLKGHLVQKLRDSALVYVGRIDSMAVIDSALRSRINLAFYDDKWKAHGDTSVRSSYAIRLQIDTLIKRSLPRRTFWIEVFTDPLVVSTCGGGPNMVARGAFLNFSSSLARYSDLNIPTYATEDARLPEAYWYKEGFVVAPEFPGLRMNLGQVLQEDSATALRPKSGARNTSGLFVGKVFLPDGRVVPERRDRKTPVPVLR